MHTNKSLKNSLRNQSKTNDIGEAAEVSNEPEIMQNLIIAQKY